MSERRVKTESELVDLVRGIDVRAPEHVHEHVRALVDERTSAGARSGRPAPWRARGWLRPFPALAGAAAAAAVAVAIVLAAGGGGGGAPSALTASRLTLSAATSAAPAESTTDGRRLTAAVDGVAFPYWEESFGWRTVGARSDRIGGREIRTVFYANSGGRRIGYAIVGGYPPSALGGGTVWHHDGTAYHLLRLNGAEAVVWLRGGRMCVVSGRNVDGHTLLRLASWGDSSLA